MEQERVLLRPGITDGESGLRRAFTVLYPGSTTYQALFLIKDKPYRERLRAYFDSDPYLVG